MMRLFFALSCSALLALASCKGSEAGVNKYKNAKHKPSEEIQKGHKKAAKKAQRDFKKQLKKNKKNLNTGGK
ncbi:MAG: hypothetical protein FD123_4280 [Bacteroidetes bacterium]|nr:MAG: hypothetical protein FD123_4280 [Bacteroidota bacterium]